MAYAITIDGRLYGYSAVDSLDAWCDFNRNSAGATSRQRQSMVRRSKLVHLDDDEASEVAEMLAAPAIRWS